jgi:hypothetical protein
VAFLAGLRLVVFRFSKIRFSRDIYYMDNGRITRKSFFFFFENLNTPNIKPAENAKDDVVILPEYCCLAELLYVFLVLTEIKYGKTLPYRI